MTSGLSWDISYIAGTEGRDPRRLWTEVHGPASMTLYLSFGEHLGLLVDV